MIPSSSELYVRELQRQEYLAAAARDRLAAEACAQAPARSYPCHASVSFQRIREFFAVSLRFRPSVRPRAARLGRV